jgi:hypothetical protein
MKNSVYIVINLFETILYVPDDETRILSEIKRFYNTVSYGEYKTIQLVSHPEEPIHLNHKYQSVFDISMGFLGNNLSVKDISIWFVNILFEDVKDYEKVFLLFEFPEGFALDNQLDRIRDELIIRKDQWKKTNVRLWDWNEIRMQMEMIKMFNVYSPDKRNKTIYANNLFIDYFDDVKPIALDFEEAKKLINTEIDNEMISETKPFGFSQLLSIEYSIMNNKFKPFDYIFRDFKIHISSQLVSNYEELITNKLLRISSKPNKPLPNQIGLLFLGSSQIIQKIIINHLQPHELFDGSITDYEKYYFLLNMEEFNKNLLRRKIFEQHIRLLKGEKKFKLDIKFGSIHNIITIARDLNGEDGSLNFQQLISKHIDLKRYKIGKLRINY